MKKPVYTHTDHQGMRWRFVGARPVSELADQVMDSLNTRPRAPRPGKGQKRKP